MIVLGIDTSADTGSVALNDSGATLCGDSFSESASHARNILSSIDKILNRAGIEKEEVELIAVSIGPGSFTGLRVGVACAKTMAYVLGYEAVGICSLEIMAQSVREQCDGPNNLLCPLRNARRGAVYGRVFENTGSSLRSRGKVIVDTPQDLAERLPEGAAVFGSGLEAYPGVFAQKRFIPIEDVSAVDFARASAAAKLGVERAARLSAISPVELNPKYYRLTEVEERVGRYGRMC